MRERVDRFLDLVKQEYNNSSDDHERNVTYQLWTSLNLANCN